MSGNKVRVDHEQGASIECVLDLNVHMANYCLFHMDLFALINLTA